MKRLILILTFITITLSSVTFGSESRIIGLLAPTFLIDDPFSMVHEYQYVNKEYNFVVFEPILSPSSFYALAKYSILSPIEKLNIGAIINYPYVELSLIPFIASGIPLGFLAPGTTPLAPFTLTDYYRDRIDLIIGLDRILTLSFLKPFVGIGYANDFSLSKNSNEQSKTETILQQSISQIEISLGSTLNLVFIELSPTLRVYFPSAVNFSSNLDANVNNYLDYRYHTLLPSFSFSINVPLKLRLDGEKTYIKGFASFFSYQLPSVQITKIDLDGNSQFDGAGEENTEITNNYGVISFGVLASYNTYILKDVLIIIGAGYTTTNTTRKLVALGTANGGTSTNDNEYESRSSQTIVPIYISTEIPFTDWLVFRAGVTGNPLEISYSYTRLGKEGQATIDTSSSSSLISGFTLGFSVKPIKGLSLDWVFSNSFINNVFINGRLPWIISGNNLFDNVFSKFSIEWVF